MQNIKTLDEVFNRVDSMSKDCHDKFIPVQHINFDSLEDMKIGSDSYSLQPIAQQEIANRLGIPLSYLRKCPSDIQAQNLNYWLSQEKNNEFFVRFNGDEVRAVFTPRYRPVDNLEILGKLAYLGFEQETKVQVSLDRAFFQLSIPDSHKTFSINGDRVTPGISITNSEVGISSLSLSAFYLRLVCTNGLISKTQVAASYRHVSLKVLSEFPKVLGNLSYELEKHKEKFQISLESSVDNPLETLDSFNRQFQMGKEEKEAVEWAWPIEKGETMFHIVNAYTRAAQYNGLSAHSSYRLQKVGGDILAMIK